MSIIRNFALVYLFAHCASNVFGSKNVTLNPLLKEEFEEAGEKLAELDAKINEAISEANEESFTETTIEEISKEIAKEESADEELEKDMEKAEKAADEELEKELEKAKESVTISDTENPMSLPKTTMSKEKISTTTSSMLATVSSIEKEEAPKDTYAVWNSSGKICLLAKFKAVFSIIYSSQGGEEKAEIEVPQNAKAKGKCETITRSPLFQVSWQKYSLSIMFNKTEDEENWIVTSMELTYDTSEPLFDRATNAGKKTARSKPVSLFETPLKKSHFCPAEEIVPLFTGNKKVVTARMKNVYLQPYDIEDGKFSPAHRCNKVVLDGPDEMPYVQDETVPLAVGCTLALITLIVLVGFSVHRAYLAAKVDYNAMP